MNHKIKNFITIFVIALSILIILILQFQINFIDYKIIKYFMLSLLISIPFSNYMAKLFTILLFTAKYQTHSSSESNYKDALPKYKAFIYLVSLLILIILIIILIENIGILSYIKNCFALIECSSPNNSTEPVKTAVDSASNNNNYVSPIVNAIKDGLEELGAAGVGAAAAGHTATALLKTLPNSLPVGSKIIITGGVSALSVAATSSTFKIINKSIQNGDIQKGIDSAIKSSQHADPDVTKIPTINTNFDSFNSPLEDHEIIRAPIEDIMFSLFDLNLSIFILILMLFFIVLNKTVLSKNIALVNYLAKKILSENLYIKLNAYINKQNKLNDKFWFVLFILLFIIITIFFIVNLIVIYHLSHNLDSYITVYNFIHKSN